MIRTLIRNWWLLALCGVLDAILAVIYFMHETGFNRYGSLVFLGRLTLAAGACTIAAGIWRSAKGKCWPLVLNGLALVALGLLFNGTFGFRISLRTIALLLVVTAISIGVLELATARTLRHQHHVADAWFLGLAGAASVGFALAFFALLFRAPRLEPGVKSELVLMACYFAFTAICMLGLAQRLHRLGPSPSGQLEVLLP